jgi:hypothetical protein
MLSTSDRLFIAMMALLVIIGCAATDPVRITAFIVFVVVAVAFTFVRPDKPYSSGESQS